MRRSAAVIIALGALMTGLVAPPASAAPGDPAPGWAGSSTATPRDLAVSGSGRAFTVGLPRTAAQGQSSYGHVLGNDWSEVFVPPRSQGGVVAGPGDYAVAVIGNVSRVFDGATWSDPVTVTADIQRSKVVGNTDGDAAMLWNAAGGAPYLSRLVRGGSWETSRVTGTGAGVLRDVAINDAGKITVVWAVPSGTTSEIRRSVLQPASTTWTTARRVGTVDDPRPNLSIVTDGQGRETLIAGNKLWRQATSTQMPAFQFRTSVRAKLAAGETGTRLVWATKADGQYEIHTRHAEGQVWRSQRLVWSYPVPSDLDCDKGIEFGVGMVPAGRSYIAVGIQRIELAGDAVLECDGQDIADFLTVSPSNNVLNLSDLGSYALGGPFQVSAGTAGPVALEYGIGPVLGEDPEEIPVDGYRVIRFFTR
ncbi:hypothetical protein C8K30_109231 [Promicromonospora sp. AC04]|uniref:hypothetical protein n=1 Tax=Promicromonospora sp. AC04 TaxID=2135723 RepID=UPI000D3F9B6D|nr:hypothetical protein [Promicromonospora sp. AC04]PUB24479.1 hypothetical protein C8K30_109231 [Promicromonospora sp. AC04]